jgi:hypothetical protein
MVTSSKGLGIENYYAGEGQQHIKETYTSSLQRGRPHKNKTITVKE